MSHLSLSLSPSGKKHPTVLLSLPPLPIAYSWTLAFSCSSSSCPCYCWRPLASQLQDTLHTQGHQHTSLFTDRVHHKSTNTHLTVHREETNNGEENHGKTCNEQFVVLSQKSCWKFSVPCSSRRGRMLSSQRSKIRSHYAQVLGINDRGQEHSPPDDSMGAHRITQVLDLARG